MPGRILYNPFKIFLLLWSGVAFCYFPAWQYGIYNDFADILEFYRQNNFYDFINRKGIVNVSLYQGTQTLLYVLISIFGGLPLPWFILFTAFHAFNGVLIFTFFQKYFQLTGLQHAKHISILGVMLFLFAPIAAETVIWKACFHYHVAVCIIFSILIWTLNYLSTFNRKYAIYIGVLFYVSTFMLELFYLTPVFVFIIILSFRILGKLDNKQTKKALLHVFLPLVLLWCIYMATYYLLYNKWIAHYEFDLQQAFRIPQIMTGLSKTMLRIYCFEYLLPHQYRTSLLGFISTEKYGWISAGILMVMSIVFVVRFRILPLKWQVAGILFVLSLASCILIIPLWYNDLNMYMNDRYYYLPGIFFFMLLVMIPGINKPKIRWHHSIFISGYFLLSLIVTFTVVMKVRGANKIYQSLFAGYTYQSADTVILLNLPNNYDGISIIPSEDGSVFKNHYFIITEDSLSSEVLTTFSHNITDPYSGVHVTVTDSLNFKITLNQYGTWWWRNSLGATNQETDLYHLILGDDGMSYYLSLKQPLSENVKLLFHSNLEWKEVDRNRFGEEQW